MSELLEGAAAARRRMWADRPSPALPLVLLAAVVTGGIVMDVIELPQGIGSDSPARLAYWVIATAVALAAIAVIARRQGFRTGLWVSRRALITGGSIALLLIALAVRYATFLPGDLLIRGNLPVLALTCGIAAWAYRERRPGLWVLTALLVPLALLADLYNMENILFRLGVPYFSAAGAVINLGVVVLVLLAAAATFALARHRNSQRLPEPA